MLPREIKRGVKWSSNGYEEYLVCEEHQERDR
jgi:hypothetical protein